MARSHKRRQQPPHGHSQFRFVFRHHQRAVAQPNANTQS
jgi:hypothetical protein